MDDSKYFKHVGVPGPSAKQCREQYTGVPANIQTRKQRARNKQANKKKKPEEEKKEDDIPHRRQSDRSAAVLALTAITAAQKPPPSGYESLDESSQIAQFLVKYFFITQQYFVSHHTTLHYIT